MPILKAVIIPLLAKSLIGKIIQVLVLIATTVRCPGMPFRLLSEPLGSKGFTQLHMKCSMQVLPYHHKDYHTPGFIPAWVPMYNKQERKTKPRDSQQRMLTATISSHVLFGHGYWGTKWFGCMKQTKCFHALIYASTTCPSPQEKQKACLPSQQRRSLDPGS